jgi:hypothetical protein
MITHPCIFSIENAYENIEGRVIMNYRRAGCWITSVALPKVALSSPPSVCRSEKGC